MNCVLVKKTIVSEIFGCHPSDQRSAFNYFINHVYNNFYHLVTDKLPWCFQCGLMEQNMGSAKYLVIQLTEVGITRIAHLMVQIQYLILE